MRSLYLALAFVALHAATAHAICSVPDVAYAEVEGGNQQNNTGRQPWIRLQVVKDADVVAMVVDGKPVEIERKGHWMRPKAPLAFGAHAQVELAADHAKLVAFTVRKDDKAAHELPVVTAIKVRSRQLVAASGCGLKGPDIWIAGKGAPKQWVLVIVFTKKPDPADPVKDLGKITSLGDEDGKGTLSTDLRNYSYDAKYMPDTLPASLWIALTDHDGHIGEILELKVK